MVDDLNELGERIAAAVSCEEYEAEHHDYGEGGYGNCAEYAAKVLLKAASRDPQGFKAALDAFRENPYGKEIDALLTEGERDVLFKGQWGLTGFQWGWAVNAAAHLLEQPAVPNPAILTIGPKDS